MLNPQQQRQQHQMERSLNYHNHNHNQTSMSSPKAKLLMVLIALETVLPLITMTQSCSSEALKMVPKHLIQLGKRYIGKVLNFRRSYDDCVTVMIVCDCKPLLQALSNSGNANSKVRDIPMSVVELSANKERLVVWVQWNCDVSGN